MIFDIHAALLAKFKKTEKGYTLLNLSINFNVI